MANVIIDSAHLTGIGDALRSALGTSAVYKPAQMASTINSVVTEYLSRYNNEHAARILACDGVLGTSSSVTCVCPMTTSLRNSAFYYNSYIYDVEFPGCTAIGNSAFYYCSQLTRASFPDVSTVGSSAFYYCSRVKEIYLGNCTSIYGTSAFRSCWNLISLYLMGSTVASITSSSIFYSTPISTYSTSAGRYGSIYVPASLLARYKAATYWSVYSARMVGI